MLLGATSWAPSTPTVARPGRHVRAVDQGERRDVAERVVDRHRRLPAAAAGAHASGSSRGSAVASGRRGAASLPVARKRLGGACGLGGGAFESSRAPGKRQEAAGGCRRSEIVLQQRRDVGRRSRRRAASWSSIDKRESQRCSETTCRRGGAGATARSGLPTTAHHRTRPQALIPHLETSLARECSTTREAASTGFGVQTFIFDALSNAPPTRAGGGGVGELPCIWTYKTQAIKVRREISRLAKFSRAAA